MKKTRLILKIAISAGLVFYLIKQVRLEVLIEAYLKIDMPVLVIPFLLMFCQVALSSFKWRVILSAEKIYVPFGFLLRSYLIGNFISLFLPTSFGGDLYRVFSLKKQNVNAYQNTSSVLFDRMSGFFALSTISIASYAVFYKSIINYNFMLVYFSCIVAFLLLTSKKILPFLEDSRSLFPQKLLKFLMPFHRYRTRKKKHLSDFIDIFCISEQHRRHQQVILHGPSCRCSTETSFCHYSVDIPHGSTADLHKRAGGAGRCIRIFFPADRIRCGRCPWCCAIGHIDEIPVLFDVRRHAVCPVRIQFETGCLWITLTAANNHVLRFSLSRKVCP